MLLVDLPGARRGGLTVKLVSPYCFPFPLVLLKRLKNSLPLNCVFLAGLGGVFSVYRLLLVVPMLNGGYASVS